MTLDQKKKNLESHVQSACDEDCISLSQQNGYILKRGCIYSSTFLM